MAITRGASTGLLTASAATSCSGNLAGPPAVGSLVVVWVWTSGAELAQGDVTDNQGNTYVIGPATGGGTGGANRGAIYYSIVTTSAGTFTVTVNPASVGSDWFHAVATEFTGFTTPVLDRQAVVWFNSSSPVTVGPTAALSANDALICALTRGGTTSIAVETVSPAWTEEAENLSGATIQGEADSKIISAGGAQSCTWTYGSASHVMLALAAFIEAPGSSPLPGGDPGNAVGNSFGGLGVR